VVVSVAFSASMRRVRLTTAQSSTSAAGDCRATSSSTASVTGAAPAPPGYGRYRRLRWELA
jgi:hypothetical protein